MPDIDTYEPTFEAARKRLGLEEGGSWEDRLAQWRKVEMRLAWMAAGAKSEQAKASYEKDLAELRKALRAIKEEPVVATGGKSSAWKWLLFTMILLGAGSGGFHLWSKAQVPQVTDSSELPRLEEYLAEALEKRRWEDAEQVVKLMKVKGASRELLTRAEAGIEEGKAEELQQQIAFLISNVSSSLETGQLTEAENYCAQVEELEPDHPKLPAFRKAISESKLQVRSRLMISAIKEAVADDDFKTARNQLESLVNLNPDHPEISVLRASFQVAEEEMLVRHEKAAKLVARARELDEGTYSSEAIALLEEAVRLHASEEIRDLYKRMSSYGKMVRVPADHATITEALKAAKVNDRVFVSKGTYQESLVIPSGVELVGENRAETIIECPAEVGSVITILSDAREVRVASLTLRHSGLVNDDERSPIVAVDGGSLVGENLSVVRASGHGVAVLNGGKVKLSLSKISDSGWDGVSVTGGGSSVEISEITCEGNLHHGIDFWDGASGVISKSIMTGNGRNGVFAIGSRLPISVISTRSEKNREVGFYFSGTARVAMTDCDARENYLGGILFTQESKGIELRGNRVIKNGEAGLVFERGVEVLEEKGNLVEENEGKQIWRDAVFPTVNDQETVSPPPPPPPSLEDGE